LSHRLVLILVVSCLALLPFVVGCMLFLFHRCVRMSFTAVLLSRAPRTMKDTSRSAKNAPINTAAPTLWRSSPAPVLGDKAPQRQLSSAPHGTSHGQATAALRRRKRPAKVRTARFNGRPRPPRANTAASKASANSTVAKAAKSCPSAAVASACTLSNHMWPATMRT